MAPLPCAIMVGSAFAILFLFSHHRGFFIPISLRLPPDIETRIAGFGSRAGLTKSAVIVRSIEEFLARHAQPSSQRIESPPADAIAAIRHLMDKYEDLPMDFCDASLVCLASSLKIYRIATIDVPDFSVYRLPSNKRFVHVLDEPV